MALLTSGVHIVTSEATRLFAGGDSLIGPLDRILERQLLINLLENVLVYLVLSHIIL